MRSPKMVALLLMAALLIPSISAAQVSWAVAERSADQIQGLVTKLLPYVDGLPGIEEAKGVVLYNQMQCDAEEGNARFCRNLIIEVRDPAALPERLRSPWIDGDEVDGLFAFVSSGGDLRHLDDDDKRVEKGREIIGRDRAVFEWGEIKKGDLIGWSIVTKVEGAEQGFSMAAAEVFPTVIANVSVLGHDQFAFKVKHPGIPSKAVDSKEQKPKDGRPMVVKASAKGLPAVSTMPDHGPYSDEQPHFLVYLDEVYIDSESPMLQPGWAMAAGWNQFVVGLAATIDKWAEDLSSTEMLLAGITAGKATPEAKAEAITRWVTSNITLLDGPEIDRDGRRELEKVFSSKEATRTEMVILTAIMMKQAEVPVSAAMFRAPEYGAFDVSWNHPVQLTTFVLRTTGESGTKWWAPQCSECEPGTLPAEWVGVEAITWDPDVVDVAKEYQEGVRKDAMAKGKFDIATMQREAEKQPWHKVVELGK